MDKMFDVSIEEKGVVSVYRGGVFIGAIENTTASLDILSTYEKEIKQLESLFEESLDVVKFYGDADNYDEYYGHCFIEQDIEDMKEYKTPFGERGGKRARSFLKKIEQMKKD